MKKAFIIFILIAGLSLHVQSQTIDNTNYYKFLNMEGNFSMGHLNSCFVVPIIVEELIKYGIADNNIGFGDLQRLNDSTRLVVTVYFFVDGKEHGFVFESSFSTPSQHDRDYLTDRSKIQYIQREADLNIKYRYALKIDPFPDNLFLLKRTCYWYQFNTSQSEHPVTKKVAERILRQDINDCLKKL